MWLRDRDKLIASWVVSDANGHVYDIAPTVSLKRVANRQSELYRAPAQPQH
ncbi:hypothetical protein J2850_005513 [Azospirillum picis]|nr:hypothetical protein [Azospirillum picis]